MNSTEMFNKTKNEIMQMYDNIQIRNHFSTEEFSMLQHVMDNIFYNIEDQINNKNIKHNKELKNNILKLLLIFERIMVFNVISESFKEFLSKILQCIFNWNININKDDSLHEKIEICNRILKSMFTMSETINILKKLILHVENNILIDNKPNVGISSQYLKILEETEEKNE